MSNLSSAEKKLFTVCKENGPRFLSTCSAMKLAGYSTALIAETMAYVQTKDPVPDRFSIVNNRYLACTDGLVYDLEACKELNEAPTEPKRMAVTFWIGELDESQA
jgi:hypothetical protein